MAPLKLPPRNESELQRRQNEGVLRVRSAAEFRALVAQSDLAEAYQHTDVVVAANAEFTDQASLHLSLGPADPPIRLRDPVLGGVAGLASGCGGDLLLPISGAARVLARRSAWTRASAVQGRCQSS